MTGKHAEALATIDSCDERMGRRAGRILMEHSLASTIHMPRRRNMAVEIGGELPKPLDEVVKKVLHRALDPRPQRFVVHISWPHADLIAHIQQPFEKKLKFTYPIEAEIGRELYTTVTAIVDEEYGPIKTVGGIE
jgi:hypothetical protein